MDSSGRGGAGKPSAAAPGTPGAAKPRARRAQGGRVVESRYLQYEKKVAKKAPAADTTKTSGKAPEGGRKAGLPQRSRGPQWPADGSGVGKGDLQSTMLEGHGAAPPDLDLSAINDRSTLRKTPQLDRSLSKRAESASFSAPRRKGPDLCEEMELMESQTLLLTLLAVKMETGLAWFEEQAERDLLRLGRELERLREAAHGLRLRRRLLVSQRKRELAGVLTAQTELLWPFEAAASRFRDGYTALATALDGTRHELPVRSVHLEGGGRRLLDALQPELNTAQRLLGELGVGSAEPTQALALLSELRGLAVEKDLELRRFLRSRVQAASVSLALPPQLQPDQIPSETRTMNGEILYNVYTEWVFAKSLENAP